MAFECVNEWPSAVLVQGGHMNGSAVPPMTYLTRSLAERWGRLREGGRARVVSARMGVNRLPQERIDNFLARFDILRDSAQQASQ
eukprot:3788136-Pyramimonas_sp.AAC.1